MLAAGGVGDRLAQCRLDQVEGRRADADHGDGCGIDQREQAAKPVSERFAGLAVKRSGARAVCGVNLPEDLYHVPLPPA